MSVNPAEGIDALRRAILRDADDIAHAEIEQARRSVDRLRQTIEQEVESERQEIVKEARRQAELIARQVASATEVEAKRRQIEARERLLRDVFDGALQMLREERGHARTNTLMQLVIEAAREIGSGVLKLQVAPQDLKQITPEFIKTVEERLAAEGIRVDLKPAKQPVNIAGGAILSLEKGNLVVDNSFEARLERQEPILRRNVWRLLMEGVSG